MVVVVKQGGWVARGFVWSESQGAKLGRNGFDRGGAEIPLVRLVPTSPDMSLESSPRESRQASRGQDECSVAAGSDFADLQTNPRREGRADHILQQLTKVACF